MRYTEQVNGLTVQAVYSDSSIRDVFGPLARTLRRLREEKGRRVIAFLAAPPAAGKSTMAGLMHRLDPGITPLGMDGFHYTREYLAAHTVRRDGRDIPMAGVKGAPETFDIASLADKLREAARGGELTWPAYDRRIHDPVPDAIRVTGDILLIEGNYLLLDADGWRELRQYADLTIFITADPGMLCGRLLARKLAGGMERERAEEFVRFSDMANVERCLARSLPADVTLRLTPDGEYRSMDEDGQQTGPVCDTPTGRTELWI